MYGFVCLMYIPCIVQLLRCYHRYRAAGNSLVKQQERVLANTFLEFTLTSLLASLTVYMCHLTQSGDFIFNPRFWITMRAMNSVISVLGNAAVCLILYSLSKARSNDSEIKVALALCPGKLTV
ncbi:uncharacterized protein MELLADRAFT_71561 [Melampsora larici-populina 98AG31]|uniref:Uncharacterized protein n=1 Tax=Melampsora larici-populina (strain 98AG31 / pathotype 3-4-7) TaxID=747676 RepID=F4RHW2_MELLP|nr:uncharacterized protein MELLADRAFT_71561 [Melampsora larici-populina 98AG31]EGG08064.1 hypothetical protein MELLADRAFT_71561 [Melampsora larici-populina 98AG31]